MNPDQAPREKPSAAPAMAACAEVLISLGATPWEAKPWFYRMLWRMGVEARPPLYAGHLQRLLIQAVPSAAIWTASMYFLAWRHFQAFALAGSFLLMTLITIPTYAWVARRTRKIKNLPAWPEVQALAAERIES